MIARVMRQGLEEKIQLELHNLATPVAKETKQKRGKMKLVT